QLRSIIAEEVNEALRGGPVRFTLVTKRFPGSPLIQVKDEHDAPLVFNTREEAEATRARFNDMFKNSPGGGPAYFVQEV
ncbi:MAG: hypothetical protein EBS90_12890, partial [Betaproteobacteria bacterium]|nr:hypothetical protein [Betaproteobacteria bacterium]